MDEGNRVPDGGYIFGDGSITLQGAVTEAVHEGPDGFELAVTGGTGIYRGATGYIFVDRARGINLPTLAGFYPARTTEIHVCYGEEDENEQ